MSDTTDRLLTPDQAAAELRISRRTLERRLASGELRSQRDGPRLLVALPTTLSTEAAALAEQVAELTAKLADVTAKNDTLSAEITALSERLAEATAKLAEQSATTAKLATDSATLTAERDQAQALLDAATSERDYLRQALAASLTLSQKLLPERTESANRAWWKVWRRE